MKNQNEIFQKATSIPQFLKRLIIKFFKINNNIIVKENVIILPYFNEELTKISSKKFQKFFKKIDDFLSNENVHTIAISNQLNSLETINIFKNNFYAKNYNILNGRWLFKHLSFNILEYISNQINKPINELEISILTNTTNEFSKENIRLLGQSIKRLNLVTSNLEYFKPLVQDMYNSFGIVIRISNNKKKILTKSDIVFNFDFPEEILNKFSLPLSGIIINYPAKIKIHNKLFNGLNINYYTINTHKELIENFKQMHLLESFNLEILYEGLYFNENSYSKMLSHFIDDNIIITSLQGNNGKIKNFLKNT